MSTPPYRTRIRILLMALASTDMCLLFVSMVGLLAMMMQMAHTDFLFAQSQESSATFSSPSQLRKLT